ncbi:hypothetical protein BDQ17DRAFT_1478689, partial [Cyathus striatus]
MQNVWLSKLFQVSAGFLKSFGSAMTRKPSYMDSCSIVVTGGKIVPRNFQLEATLALLSGIDSLVDVGTGYGKTLCLILPSILFPDQISLVISPLKHLQALQLLEFEKYQVTA